MTKQARVLVGAAVAGVLVAVLPSVLLGPGFDPTKGAQIGWGALPLLFLAGVLTSLTPCVYPLIPITVSIFGARHKAGSRGRAAALSGTYVAGIASTYSALGLAAAASGKAFGAFMGNPLVVGLFALMMVAFALSMFGLFELQLPASLQTKLSGVAGIGFGSAFAMGLVAGVVAAPCTGPALGAVLTKVAQTRDLWMGFWLLFTYALGMGLLFFVVGTFSVSLPRSGAWMDGVKTILGVALLVVAISFVRPLLPTAPSIAVPSMGLALVAGVLVAGAILAGAVHRSFHGSLAERLVKGGGVAVAVLALALRFGWIVEPQHGGIVRVADAAEGAQLTPAPTKIEWIHDEAVALARSKAENKPIIADFFATWCTACVELDKHTFTDPRVRQIVSERFIPLKVDGTDDADEGITALQNKYGVVGLPLVTVITPEGKQLNDPKIQGFLGPEEFLKELAKVRVE